jgi:hypothetical protein
MSLLDLPKPAPIIGARKVIGSLSDTRDRSPSIKQPPSWLNLLPATSRFLQNRLHLDRYTMSAKLRSARDNGWCRPEYPSRSRDNRATWFKV